MKIFYPNIEKLPIVQDCIKQLPALINEINVNRQLFTHATEIEGFENFRGNEDTYELETEGWFQIFLKWNSFQNCLTENDYRKFIKNIEKNQLQLPVASNIVERYDNVLDAFGFSLIQPGTHIPLHKDLPGNVRVHICLVEDFESKIYFNDVGYGLHVGEAYGFASTYEHELLHTGVNDRIHIIFDINTSYVEKYIVRNSV